MPSLDIRGKIAAAEIGFYAPIAVLTALLVFRYAFRRDAGWFFLCIFSMVRIAGSALMLAGQLQGQTGLLIASLVMDSAGVGALLLSSLGFIGMAGQHTYSENRRITTLLRFVGIATLAALGLTIAGGIINARPAQQNTGLILRRAGASLFAAVYVSLFLTHVGTWSYRWHLRSYRRNLLFGICTALPFLGVRIAYAVIAAWSSSDLFGAQLSPNPTLAKLNPVTGTWILYLVLSLIMEFVVASLYLFSSTVLARRHHH
ncbi:hypothetical protein BJ165DRAFT_1522368 [Panaeolus papilionaceus]|nr:hypothetical protein BJ165DRAFT_1522368 [Panaeolus papilionaceus]